LNTNFLGVNKNPNGCSYNNESNDALHFISYVFPTRMAFRIRPVCCGFWTPRN
jgi:hypothetical protein